MEGLTTLDIQHILSKHKATSNIFLGVFASDELVSETPNSSLYCLVCNIDESWQPGSHWVAIFVNDRQIEYFDPYGFYPFSNNIDLFLKREKRRKGLNIYMNSTKLQSMYSTACGHFCVTFCISRACGHGAQHYVNMFHHAGKDLHKNDVIVKALMRIRKSSIKHSGVQGCLALCNISSLQ
jgi:hypothetical protein